MEIKTTLQERIEYVVTNGRFYQTVPYDKSLSDKRALRQWLKFSRDRVLNLVISDSDETHLKPYLSCIKHERNIAILAEAIRPYFRLFGQIEELAS